MATEHSQKILNEGDFGTFQPEPGVHIRYARFDGVGAPRGQLVLAHGRSEFIEKYVEVIDELVQQGWTVWTMDWRGQGLSSRMLPNRHKGHIDRFETYLKDFDAFVSRIVGPKSGTAVLLAHSMGGHLALRYLQQNPSRFDVAVFSAPMIGVHTPIHKTLLLWLAEFAVRLGLGSVYVSGGDYGPDDYTFHSNRLTRDPQRFQRCAAFIDENPELAVAGLTLGWLAAALRSMHKIERDERFETLATPVLMVCAGNDQRVDNAAIRRLAARMTRGKAVFLVDSEHELLMEREPIRERFWALFNAFISREVKART